MTRITLALVAAAGLLFPFNAEAVATPEDGKIAGPIVLTDTQLDSLTAGQTGDLALLLDNAVERSLIAGLAFTIAAILKFKAHHDNPTFPWLDIPGLAVEP